MFERLYPRTRFEAEGVRKMTAAAKILIVEDEAVLALSMQDILERAAYDVVGVVSDFQRAFVVAQQERPDLAIIDFKLANAIDGTTVALELTKRYGLQVIFATGHPGGMPEAGNALAFATLSKPYTPEQLLAAVSSCLENRTESEV